MSTISKMETPTGQEETAILLEEQARRIATLQESLRQACHNPHSNDRVIMQEVDRLVKERDDLKRKLGNAELLIEKLKEEVKELNFSAALRTAEETNHGTHDRPVETLLLIKELGRMSKKLDALKGSLRNIADNAAHWDTGCGPDASAFGWIHDTAEAALRTAEESSVVDRTPAKQPEVITKLGKAVQNIDVTKRVLVENSCPSEFGLEDCEFNPQSGCTLCCEDCWNGEVES